MKQILVGACLVMAGLMLVQSDVQAKRLGSGNSTGMKRNVPNAPPAAAPAPTPAKPAQAAPAQAPAAAATAAAAAPAKRSWMGPLAGLAAGLGIAALASHLGFGEGLANIMTVLLVVMAGALLIGFLLKRFGGRRAPAGQGLQGMQFANAGFGSAGGSHLGADQPAQREAPQQQAFMPAQTLGSGAAVAGTVAAQAAPADFDTAAFETIAKRVFIRLQAANDAGDLDDLRRFTTPEMFAAARQELLDRGSQTQQTDVVQLQAQIADHAEEDGRQIVSVRFNGLIRESQEAAATPFDEVWHLVRPLDGSREWAIAGIQPSH